MTLLVLSLVAGGCLLALYNWRWGIVAAVVVGLLQDPLRKMMPGAPAYMVLVSLPIWLVALSSALFRRQLNIRCFLSGFPQLARWFQLFAVYLIIPAALSASYGRNSWQITLLGMFFYVAVYFLLVAGWQYPGARTAPDTLLVVYALVAGILLLGGPLEYLGWGRGHPALGTAALGHVWVTHRTGSAVYMLAGFFRSPDVMGWHAALVFMIALLLAYRARGSARLFWILLAAWAVVSVWLCGRRKMLAMLPVFMGVYFWLGFRFNRVRQLVAVGATGLIVLGLGWYLIASYYYDPAVQTFYWSALTDVEQSVQKHGIQAVLYAIDQAGFWGYGLGMSQQGVHNIDAETPRLWQESGPGKLVSELGVPGSILFIVLGGVLLMTAYHVVQRSQRDESFYITSGIMAILIANLTSAMVSAQIFGDPLVLFLLAFMMGLLLSNHRIIRAPAPDLDRPWDVGECPAPADAEGSTSC